MKVTFFDPPISAGQKVPERVFGCTYELHPFPNIYELYLAAVLEREGHEVAYLNAPFKGFPRDDFRRFLQQDNSDLYVIYSVYLATETRQVVRLTLTGFVAVAAL